MQFSIPQESRKIKSIPRGPRGISWEWNMQWGAIYLSKSFFSRNICKNSEENDERCLISDKHKYFNKKMYSWTDRIWKYCENWLHFEQTLNFRGPWRILFKDLREPRNDKIYSSGSEKRSGTSWNKELLINVSSVVEFQRWWVLKSKIFGQESTYEKDLFFWNQSMNAPSKSDKNFDELTFPVGIF